MAPGSSFLGLSSLSFAVFLARRFSILLFLTIVVVCVCGEVCGRDQTQPALGTELITLTIHAGHSTPARLARRVLFFTRLSESQSVWRSRRVIAAAAQE